MPLVIVDAENVRRSEWPNIRPAELVAAVRAWADAEGHEPLVVFDGPAPDGAVGTGAESADDWIVREAATLASGYWLVTSDRELRRRAGARAGQILGGGAFARTLRAFRG